MLPGRRMDESCLTSFKKYLNEHLACQNIQGYGPSAGEWDKLGVLVFLGVSVQSRWAEGPLQHCMFLSFYESQ